MKQIKWLADFEIWNLELNLFFKINFTFENFNHETKMKRNLGEIVIKLNFGNYVWVYNLNLRFYQIIL